jgi:hypothetical protein
MSQQRKEIWKHHSKALTELDRSLSKRKLAKAFTTAALARLLT